MIKQEKYLRYTKVLQNYGNSCEISIPSRLLPVLKFNITEIKNAKNNFWRPNIDKFNREENKDTKNWPILLFLWLNENLNMEVTSAPNKIKKMKRMFLICHPRAHGGSCVFTIPPAIIDAYEILGIDYWSFKIFENENGNIEFQLV